MKVEALENQVKNKFKFLFSLLRALAITLAIAGLGNIAFAQKTSSSNSSNSSSNSSSSEKSDRLDIKSLEDNYWSAKDTDMAVVQNRTFTKDHRFFGSFSYGVLLNDSFSYGRMTNFAFGYYFTERWGVELAYEKGTLSDNDGTTTYKNSFAVGPAYNRFQNYTSINGVWVPFYAKMSFMDRKILYFDIQFAVGLGQVAYESQLDPAQKENIVSSSYGYNFDFSQQLFFTKHFALRLDVKNKWYTQDKYRWQIKTNLGQTEADRSMGKTYQQDTSMILGLTYFY